MMISLWQMFIHFRIFSDIEDRDKKEKSKNSRIEEDVMDAASKYIESIMSNNSR